MIMSQRDTFIHLVAGGVAGTAGAVVTCPLEVVKTRLQSSNPVFGVPNNGNGNGHSNGTGGGGGGGKGGGEGGSSYRSGYHQRHHTKHSLGGGSNPGDRGHMMQSRYLNTCVHCGVRNSHMFGLARSIPSANTINSMTTATNSSKLGLLQCLRLIIEKEGPRALFKGLGPNLVGVAPSRAIYFCAYSQSKKTFNQLFPAESPVVHICSAATAGFVSCTMTNPVWFVKTRLQLDNRHNTITETCKRIYKQGGILGFYKGITASYMGISETVIHFVIYEAVKKKLNLWARSNETLADGDRNPDEKTTKDFLSFMVAGAISKTCASVVAYPHEVARTRLREEGSKYRRFWQTLSLVAQEEGYRGLYRGLGTQLIRQIPNTAIMMSTYEATVYLFSKYLPQSADSSHTVNNGDLINQDDGYSEVTFEVDSGGANHARH